MAAEAKEEYFDFSSDEFKNAEAIVAADLALVWEEMVKKITVGRSNLSSTLSASKPRVGDKFQVIIDVKNAIQEKEIDTFKNEIVNFLRPKLNNRFIRLQVIVNPEIQDARPYLPADIFKHMAEKNPAIVTLKEKFGLEPE